MGDADKDAVLLCWGAVLLRLPDTEPLRLRPPPPPPLAIISALPKCNGDGCGVKGAWVCMGDAKMGKAAADSAGD